MKTTKQTTKRFPDGFRMILYIVAVAALGFLSFTVKAADPEKASDYSNRLEAASTPQTEPEIRLENWMLNFNDEDLLEAWMIDPADWVVPDYLIVEMEEETVLEDWMLDPTSFTVPDYLIVEKEEEPVLEEWMLDPGYHVDEPLFMAKNNQ